MRTKLFATILLSVIGLLLVVGGTSHAQPLDSRQPIHQQTISNTVYLPIVSKPPCTFVPPTAYIAASQPIVRVGDSLTVTGALMNDCAIIEHPNYQLHASPEGLISPSHIITSAFSQYLPFGGYVPFTFTVQAVAAGEVTIDVASGFLIYDPAHPWPPANFGGAASRPAVVRILP